MGSALGAGSADFSAVPISSLSSPKEGGAALPDKMQVIDLLAGTVLTVPGSVNLKLAGLKSIQKFSQHNIIKELITKFKPVLNELAVLAIRSQQSQPRVEKPPVQAPVESGARRDEAAPKGSSPGKDLVSIEVHGSEEGRNDPQQQSPEKGKADQTVPVKKEGDEKSKEVPSAKEGTEGEILPIDEGQSPSEMTPPEATDAKPDQPSVPENQKSSETNEVQTGEGIDPSVQNDGQDQVVDKSIPSTPTSESSQKNEKIPEIPQNTDLSQNVDKNIPVPESQIVSSNTSQEAQNKPAEADPDSVVLPQEVDSTDENAPDATVGIKEVPKGEDSTIENEKEIPDDLRREQILNENSVDLKRPEDVAVLAPFIRTQSDESVPTAHHKLFQAVENDSRNFVPPWLALMLPDLIKVKTERDSKGGGRQGLQGQKPHKLTDILFMLLCAHLVGAKSLADVFNSIQAREKWFTVTLGLKNGMPPRQLIFWVLTTLDPNAFDRVTYRWLQEVLGKNVGPSKLLDIFLVQTSGGYIVAQTRRPERNFSVEDLNCFADGFSWKNSVLLMNADCGYGQLLFKIQRQRGHYLAEVDHELVPAEEFEQYESYVEGQERIVVQEWYSEEKARIADESSL